MYTAQKDTIVLILERELLMRELLMVVVVEPLPYFCCNANMNF
jgi:hypothetical protein